MPPHYDDLMIFCLFGKHHFAHGYSAITIMTDQINTAGLFALEIISAVPLQQEFLTVLGASEQRFHELPTNIEYLNGGLPTLLHPAGDIDDGIKGIGICTINPLNQGNLGSGSGCKNYIDVDGAVKVTFTIQI